MPPCGNGAGAGELEQVETLLRPSLLAGRLRAVGGVPSRGRLHVLDARYDPGERCTVLYEVGGSLVVATLELCCRRDVTAADRLLVRRFPSDPALPGLARAFDPHGLASSLGDALPGGPEWRIVRCRPTLVRYRPARSCTIRIDLIARHDGTGLFGRRTLFAKMHRDDRKAEASFRLSRDLAAAGASLEVLRVARPVAFLPAFPLSIYEEETGAPLDRLALAGEGGRPAVALAGRALAEFHAVPVRHPRRRTASEELSHVRARCAPTAAVAPRRGAAFDEALDALDRRREQLELDRRDVVLGHGDVKPSQFLIRARHATLLDLDHGGMADAAMDVGSFVAALAGARVGARSGDASPTARARCVELERTFLEGYGGNADLAGTDFGARVDWWAALALVRKARRAAARSNRSPLPERLVKAALERLRAGSELAA